MSDQWPGQGERDGSRELEGVLVPESSARASYRKH